MIRVDLVGHDGGRVGIDQDHFNSFFPKASGRLGTGIIKLARLTYDDGAATDDKNGADASVSGHFRVDKLRLPARSRLGKGRQK